MEPRLRASPEQFSVLIDFMERHGDLSRPQSGPQGRSKGDRLWQELTQILNSLGGGVQKSSLKWKKVWADWKTKSKKKYLNLRLQASRTGGGPSSGISLTALEERVVAIIGASAVVGQAGIQEQGLHPGSADDVQLEPGQYEFDIVLDEPNSLNIAIDSLPQPEEEIPPPSLPPQSLTPPPPPPTLPRTPPARNYRRQASASPRSTSTSRPRVLLGARRNRGLTPFERTAELFSAVEERRLVQEEARNKRFHEMEMERLRLEAEKIVVSREHNVLIHQLCLIGQRLLERLD